MSQVITGIRSVLSIPIVYSAFQFLMGAHQGKKLLVKEYIQPNANDKVLDIGCGPADILGYLPEDVCYWGYDISEEYIEKARKKYGHRGTFTAKLIELDDLPHLPQFDVVVLNGVFHHLDDRVADEVIALAYASLKEGGRLVSKDACYSEHQSPIAKFLISKDRGQNIRDEQGYKALMKKHFPQTSTQVVHKVWIPYTHCYMEGTK